MSDLLWIKGATCSHILHIQYTTLLYPEGVYCQVRGICFDRREYIAGSGVYIWQFTTAVQRNEKFFLFLQWNSQFPPVLTTQEPLSAL